MKKFTAPVIVSLVAVVGLLTGCGSPAPMVDQVVSTPVETVAPAAPVEETVEVEPAGENSTVAMLNELPVAEPYQDGYSRDSFKHWVSKNDTGCDTRVAVLIREVQNGSVSGCSVSGTWVSVYDNVTTNTPKDFDIDHMVPLSEAYASGAYQWDADTREAYANDLDYPYSLLAVSAASNRSKSDSDPTKWMPTTMDGCEYVARWVGVKHRWGLSVDQAEKDKILSVLSWCGGDYTLAATPVNAPVSVSNSPATQDTTPVDAPQQSSDGVDPQFSTCKEAKSNGYGPYTRDVNPEYDWYQDRDGDGTVCE